MSEIIRVERIHRGENLSGKSFMNLKHVDVIKRKARLNKRSLSWTGSSFLPYRAVAELRKPVPRAADLVGLEQRTNSLASMPLAYSPFALHTRPSIAMRQRHRQSETSNYLSGVLRACEFLGRTGRNGSVGFHECRF